MHASRKGMLHFVITQALSKEWNTVMHKNLVIHALGIFRKEHYIYYVAVHLLSFKLINEHA